MTDATLVGILVALAAAAVLIGAAIATRRRTRLRHAELRQRFGPEYDQAVAQYGSAARADRALAARERRVGHLKLSELSDAERARFASHWTTIQGRFVDDPLGAVAAANSLINEVMRARGYPTEDFDQRLADLSVDHAGVVQHYRAARALSTSVANDPANTEELRQAVVHYRALFADLLEEPVTPSHRHREAHA